MLKTALLTFSSLQCFSVNLNAYDNPSNTKPNKPNEEPTVCNVHKSQTSRHCSIDVP